MIGPPILILNSNLHNSLIFIRAQVISITPANIEIISRPTSTFFQNSSRSTASTTSRPASTFFQTSRNFTPLSRQKTRPWAMLSAPDLNNQMTCRYEGFAYIPDEPKK